MPPITVAESRAFVEAFEVAPTSPGPLDGLRFAAKDLIDLAGRKTGCGNPRWLDTHPPAASHAVCVEQLLGNGAACVGKVITDQLAFSLLGENFHYGTPLNPRAPDRMPGGSSSGSASAVACGLCDFALGTDTGGSVRVPASNCGVWGFRPSWGVVSVAGVMPFAPTFDTVGLLARSASVLTKAASVLLSLDPTTARTQTKLNILTDAFALADAEVRDALEPSLQRLRQRYRVREVTLADLGEADFAAWLDAYCVLQWAEVKSCLGAWIADAKPDFGPTIAASFAMTDTLDRRRVAGAARARERLYRHLRAVLGPNDLLVMPTTPALAQLKGAELSRGQVGGYYPRALSLTSVAGIGRLPQVSMPLAESAGVPVGLSLLAAHGDDAFLLAEAASWGG